MSTLDSIVNSITRGNLKEALSELSDLVATTEELSNHRNAIITLSARYHQLQRRRISGLISSGEAQITENQIRYNTLELIDILRSNTPQFRQDGSMYSVENDHVESSENFDFPADKKIKVLLLAASPYGMDASHYDKEFEMIKNKLEIEGFSKRLSIKRVLDTTSRTLLANLMKYKPDVVHFSGHSNLEGIFLVDSDKNAVLVSPKKLGEVFKIFSEDVSCVVLNSCFSLPQAEKINEHIRYVIGTTNEILAKSAFEFSANFYEALGRGYDIDTAFHIGKAGATIEDDENEVIKLMVNREIGGNNE